MTLAHELGHGVHQILAAPVRRADGRDPADVGRNRQCFRGDADLSAPARRHHTTPPSARRCWPQGRRHDQHSGPADRLLYLRAHSAHERRHGELTANRLCEIWLEVQRESLGPTIHPKPGYETFWAYIPHFIHAPFYVYAYAFGDCLVNSLYAVYESYHRLRSATSRCCAPAAPGTIPSCSHRSGSTRATQPSGRVVST